MGCAWIWTLENSVQMTFTCFLSATIVQAVEELPSLNSMRLSYLSVKNMQVWWQTDQSTTWDGDTTTEDSSTATPGWRFKSYGKQSSEEKEQSKYLESKYLRDHTSTSELLSVASIKTLTSSFEVGSYATFWQTADSTRLSASCKASCIDSTIFQTVGSPKKSSRKLWPRN